MPGFSQMTRPRTSAAVSAPGNRDVDGYDRPVTGLQRLTPAGPGTADPGSFRRAPPEIIGGSPCLT